MIKYLDGINEVEIIYECNNYSLVANKDLSRWTIKNDRLLDNKI